MKKLGVILAAALIAATAFAQTRSYTGITARRGVFDSVAIKKQLDLQKQGGVAAPDIRWTTSGSETHKVGVWGNGLIASPWLYLPNYGGTPVGYNGATDGMIVRKNDSLFYYGSGYSVNLTGRATTVGDFASIASFTPSGPELGDYLVGYDSSAARNAKATIRTIRPLMLPTSAEVVTLINAAGSVSWEQIHTFQNGLKIQSNGGWTAALNPVPGLSANRTYYFPNTSQSAETLTTSSALRTATTGSAIVNSLNGVNPLAFSTQINLQDDLHMNAGTRILYGADDGRYYVFPYASSGTDTIATQSYARSYGGGGGGAMTGQQIVDAINGVLPVWTTTNYFDATVWVRNDSGFGYFIDPTLLTAAKTLRIPNQAGATDTVLTMASARTFGVGGGAMGGDAIVAAINAEVPNVTWDTEHLFDGGLIVGGVSGDGSLSMSKLTTGRTYFFPNLSDTISTNLWNYGRLGRRPLDTTSIAAGKIPLFNGTSWVMQDTTGMGGASYSAGWGINIVGGVISADSGDFVTPNFTNGNYPIAQGDSILKDGSIKDSTVGGTPHIVFKKPVYMPHGFAGEVKMGSLDIGDYLRVASSDSVYGTAGSGGVQFGDVLPDSMSWTQDRTFVIDSSLINASHSFGLGRLPNKYIIDSVVVVLVDGSSPSIAIQLKHNADRSVPGTSVWTSDPTVTSTTTGTKIAATVNDNTVDAGEWLWVIFPTVTTKPRLAELTMYYRSGR